MSHIVTEFNTYETKRDRLGLGIDTSEILKNMKVAETMFSFIKKN